MNLSKNFALAGLFAGMACGGLAAAEATAPNPAAPDFIPGLWNDRPGGESAVIRLDRFYESDTARTVREQMRVYAKGPGSPFGISLLLHQNTDQKLADQLKLEPSLIARFRKTFQDAIGNSIQLRTNCYAYSVQDLDGHPPGWKPTPDEISSRPKKGGYTPEAIIEAAQRDGLILAGDNPAAKKGHYLTAFYVKNSHSGKFIDYHFVRQDRTGWSHKLGHEPARNTDLAGQVIRDPRTANLGPYKLRTFFYVPENGLEIDLISRQKNSGVVPRKAPAL